MAKKSFHQFLDILGENVRSGKITEEENIKKNIQILPEFKEYLPALSSEEEEVLRSSLLENGCREKILVWHTPEDTYILIDGHNRFRICQELGLPFGIQLLYFESKEAAFLFMIQNQMGKRNLSSEWKSYLRGQRYLFEKKDIGGQGKNQYTTGEHQESTSEKLAKAWNVSEKTIRRDGQYAEALNALTEKNDILKNKILNKEVKVPKRDLIQYHQEQPENLPTLAQCLEKGETWPQQPTQSNTDTQLDLHKEIQKILRRALKEQRPELLEEGLKLWIALKDSMK